MSEQNVEEMISLAMLLESLRARAQDGKAGNIDALLEVGDYFLNGPGAVRRRDAHPQGVDREAHPLARTRDGKGGAGAAGWNSGRPAASRDQGVVRTLPQRADREGRGVCDGEGEGLRYVLGGGVSERDGLRRDEDADAAA